MREPGRGRGLLPGDDTVARPFGTTEHAVTVAAPPEQVRPRIVQMGYHRGGSYAPPGDERRLDLLVVPSDFVMAGAMLRGIAERAERPASHPATDGST